MQRWYALHTKPRKEHQVRDLLESRGIETYLPALPAAGRRPSRRRSAEPLFACYLFAHLDLGQVPLSSVNWTPGVNRVVSYGGQPAVVRDEIIGWLRRRLQAMDGRDLFQGLPLRPSERLRITAGPLRGLEAIFDRRLSGDDRARVFVELMGRLTACELDLACLERG